MNKKVEDALNQQIKHELDSAYVYLSMSAFCESRSLTGFAHWMRSQYEEETVHAMRLYDFVHARGGRVALKGLDQPPTEFGSPLKLFQEVLDHEKRVTGLIHDLYELALSEKDYATQVELQWFITEQVEEEASVGDIIDQLKLVGDSGPALHRMDRHLAKRGAEAE